MAKLNKPRPSLRTHERAVAKRITPEQQLRRSLMSCMLWEKQFYEDGEDIARRIERIIPEVKPQRVADIADEARNKMHLRHAPLLVARAMAKIGSHKPLLANTLSRIIQRPDELTEFLAIYWKDKKQPLSAQTKKGLAKAFQKFDEYQLAKYNRGDAIKLRDVLFLCHAKPKDKAQERMWKRLIDGNLKTPDTWEVALSASSTGAEKRQEWERLLSEGKLGGLALLRNLRNFQRVNVNENLIINGINRMNTSRILPFRFIAAARYAPHLEQYLENAMFKCLKGKERLQGHTVLLVDVSGSMTSSISSKSDMTRQDAAIGLAILLRELCQRVDIVTFSNNVVRVAPRRGFALRDAINTSQPSGGTYLGNAIKVVYERGTFTLNTWGWGIHNNRIQGFGLRPDRLIVITDEQSHDRVQDPLGRGYMINVASYKNGVGYGPWVHIDGFSEAIVDYLKEYEVFEKDIMGW